MRTKSTATITTTDTTNNVARMIPCPVLEYILTYLPDPITAILPLVCYSWHEGIQQQRQQQHVW